MTSLIVLCGFFAAYTLGLALVGGIGWLIDHLIERYAQQVTKEGRSE